MEKYHYSIQVKTTFGEHPEIETGVISHEKVTEKNLDVFTDTIINDLFTADRFIGHCHGSKKYTLISFSKLEI